MENTWQYYKSRSKSGDLEKGFPKSWDKSRNNGNYDVGLDFFSVHWEVHIPKFASSIRLHVESPRYEKDPILNDLKQEVIAAITSSDIASVIQNRGCSYRVGSRISSSHIQKNKCTEVFRVELMDNQRRPTHREDIEKVHTQFGPAVDAVLQRFEERLREQFG